MATKTCGLSWAALATNTLPVAALADSNPEHPNCFVSNLLMAFTLTGPGLEQTVMTYLDGYNHFSPVNAA